MTARPGYDWAERKRRAAFVAKWRKQNGDLCPGYGRAPHMVNHAKNPITADHVDPVGRGGDERGELQALCRACNATKRDGRLRVRSNGHAPYSPPVAERCPHAGRVVAAGEYGQGIPAHGFTHPANCPYAWHSFHSRPW
jgi:hypothetical protein